MNENEQDEALAEALEEVLNEIEAEIESESEATAEGETAPAEEKETQVRNDDLTFMEAYEKASTKEEACKALGIAPATLDQRASKLRKLGAPLKYFPRKSRKSESPLEILAKIRGVTVEQLQAENEKRLADKAAKKAAKANA